MTTSTSACRSCTAPITWGESATGKRTPFDLDGRSHFETCPQSREWSGRSAGNGSAVHSAAKDHAIAKMSALRSAAIYCGHRATVDGTVKSEHIFVLAERMLAWLEKGDPA